MILKELQEFILSYRRVSLADMETHFHTDGDTLKHMLKKLIVKGRVRKLETNTKKCGGCNSCNADSWEIYEWVGNS